MGEDFKIPGKITYAFTFEPASPFLKIKLKYTPGKNYEEIHAQGYSVRTISSRKRLETTHIAIQYWLKKL